MFICSIFLLPVFHNAYDAKSYKFCAELNKSRKRLKTFHPFQPLRWLCVWIYDPTCVVTGELWQCAHSSTFQNFLTEVLYICMDDRPSFDYRADSVNAEFWGTLHNLCKTENSKYFIIHQNFDKSFGLDPSQNHPVQNIRLLHSLRDVKGLFIRKVKINNAWIMASWRLSCRIAERIEITSSFTRPLFASWVRSVCWVDQMKTLKHYLVTFRSISGSSATPVCLSNSVLIVFWMRR